MICLLIFCSEMVVSKSAAAHKAILSYVVKHPLCKLVLLLIYLENFFFIDIWRQKSAQALKIIINLR